ncbi:ATP-dependent RNA helicase DDX24 [Bradysia coprophila]|uniref:ATP-dependent RNA helicase DDX24 n=1 Tax=Bradysia coprophila TaxID=38358 RepID=UPI00187DBBD8|nr:ATP-dependent RNA helicase DDX24 [Bradysia coprophila]
MKNKSKLKSKATNKRPQIEGSWSKVKIAGNLITNDGGGLEGLVGLEVLENYDKNIIAKVKKSKKRQREDDEDELQDKPKVKQNKKQKINHAVPSKPGRYVLINPQQDDESDDEAEKETDTDVIEATDLLQWKTIGVPDVILKALAEKKFTEPTQIQSLTIPAAIMGRKDILGAAETGSGKTLAFGIPILNGIIELKKNGDFMQSRTLKTKAAKAPVAEKEPKSGRKNRAERENLTPPPDEINNFPSDDENGDPNDHQQSDAKPLYALVLTPTRELAVQVKDHLVAVAKYTGIKVAAVFGGMAQVKQERVLSKCPEIVVATPGRLWELLSLGNEHLNKMENISFLVIDETDRMIEKGHFEELTLLLGRLNADPVKKARRQNFIFSATLTMVHELPSYIKSKNVGRKSKAQKQTSEQKIQMLIDHLGISQPKIVDVTKKSGTADKLTECRIICDLEQKDLYLYYFLQRHPGRTIVFCNSIDCVKRLGQLFNLLNCQPRPLHAQMNQRQRLKNLEKFTASPTGLLIATDVAARGLDIPNVQHVIHYQVPRTTENYVHRSGRTARANNEGITVLIMEPGEVKNYVKLCRTLQRAEDLPLFPVSEQHLKAVRARVELAREVDVLDLKTRRTQSEIGWLKKSAKEMDIIVDDMSDFSENELYDSDDGGDRFKVKRELKQKRDNLNKLLAKPLFTKGFSYKYPLSTGQLNIPSMDIEDDKQNAVNVMKEAIEDYKAAKKRHNKKNVY